MSQIVNYGATAPLAIQAGGTFQTSNDPSGNTLVGSRWILEDGREVMLVSAGSTTIASAGLLVQDAAIVANHQGLAVTTVTAYSANGNQPPSVAVTLGATALQANQYQGGMLMVDSGPGIGQTLLISSNPAALSSATNVTLTLEDGANTALTTSSTVCLLPPHGANVIVFPTTATGAAAGITLYPLASGTTATPTLGYVVTKGITAALSDVNVPSVGQEFFASAINAGSITLNTGTGASFGYANQTAVSAKARSVFVNL